MNPHLVPERDLAALTGHLDAAGGVRRGQLKRYLKRQGVPFLPGAGGAVWTTVSALEQALGIRPETPTPAPSTDTYPEGIV